MSVITFEILFIVLLLIVNGVFAMSELAVVASRKTRLQRLAASGDPRASTALELAQQPERFLSTIPDRYHAGRHPRWGVRRRNDRRATGRKNQGGSVARTLRRSYRINSRRAQHHIPFAGHRANYVQGRHFEWHGLRFEIVDMDGKRINKVLVMATKMSVATRRE